MKDRGDIYEIYNRMEKEGEIVKYLNKKHSLVYF